MTLYTTRSDTISTITDEFNTATCVDIPNFIDYVRLDLKGQHFIVFAFDCFQNTYDQVIIRLRTRFVSILCKTYLMSLLVTFPDLD